MDESADGSEPESRTTDLRGDAGARWAWIDRPAPIVAVRARRIGRFRSADGDSTPATASSVSVRYGYRLGWLPRENPTRRAADDPPRFRNAFGIGPTTCRRTSVTDRVRRVLSSPPRVRARAFAIPVGMRFDCVRPHHRFDGSLLLTATTDRRLRPLHLYLERWAQHPKFIISSHRGMHLLNLNSSDQY